MRLDKTVILQELSRLYPNAESELDFNSDYELVSAVLLSAQCTDKKVNEVTPVLFKKFPSFSALSRAKLHEVEKIIRPVNYYRTKSKNLISMASIVTNDFKEKLPRTHQELISLPGVGNKTANVVLNELGIEPTFPVDTHVFRVSKRLGFAKGKNVEEVEEELKKLFKPSEWRELHHWLILHGRRVCKARNPICKDCAVAKYCPSCQL